jgi:uncharacterized protein (TIGR00725 family)
MPQALRYAAVIGKGGNCPPAVRDLAVRVGLQLAALHPAVVLVCGGLGGVMDAAAQGMTKGGGVAIGLVPAGHTPSVHLTYAIRLGLPLLFRDIITAMAADLVIVLPGSHGTVIEGWAAADRRLPLVGVGDHSRFPSACLPFTATAEPAELPALAAQLLGPLEVDRADQGRDLVP